MNGLNAGDLVSIRGVDGNPGGIPAASLNTLHTVIDANINTFTIMVDTPATSSEKTGGADV